MSDSGSSAPAGWYPDGEGGQRWWDGTQWGPVGQPPAAEPSPPTTPMPTTPPPSSPPQYDPPRSAAPGYGGPPEPGQAQPGYGTPYAAAAGFPPPGQDPSGAGASGKNTKLLLAIVGGLVGLVVLVIVLVLALGGGNGPSSDDPAETVSSFFDAARDGDCDAAFDLLTDNAKATMGADPDDCDSVDPADGLGEDVAIDVGEARIDGDDATVPVTLKDDSGDLGPGDFTLDLEMKKVDGAWLIDGFGFGSLFDGLSDDLLSDLPTDVNPDDFLSDLPTDFLSDLDPGDFPSDFPSDFLSDFNPEDYLSDFPTDFNPDDFLSELPTDFFTEFSNQ